MVEFQVENNRYRVDASGEVAIYVPPMDYWRYYASTISMMRDYCNGLDGKYSYMVDVYGTIVNGYDSVVSKHPVDIY